MALLLFVGATGKSAQFPLYVWLPDAMEGPTPVSALIHAATMVTAGVYMVARSNAAVPADARDLDDRGRRRRLHRAFWRRRSRWCRTTSSACWPTRPSASSATCSWRSASGAYWVAIFHLFTHAFFKALLFLGSGSVIHAMGGEQDMRKMGGLQNKIPVTHWTMFIGTLAIAGIPGLAGFFSKDEILWQAYSSPHGFDGCCRSCGLVTAGMTAFYMWRLMY